MEISIKRDRTAFLEAVVTDGRYPSADADVDEALRLFEERERKLKDLQDTIDASITEGGAYSSDEVRQYLQEARDRRNAARARSAAAYLSGRRGETWKISKPIWQTSAIRRSPPRS